MAKKAEAEITQPKPGEFNVQEFVNDTKEELNKVVWPSRQQLISESAAVILMVIVFAVAIYLLDNFLKWGASQVFYK